MHTASNDLFFGLRGAGSSLAIVTDFLYRINLEPETRYLLVSTSREYVSTYFFLKISQLGDTIQLSMFGLYSGKKMVLAINNLKERRECSK